mmetsp:Transcript_31619/g.46047  ORF Transcript_31619/g.46047 Transcript_31619/m.46047 type:complete len:164 (-) Transcript_31619:246-737(-)|eukprot:CAMPEP_0116045684 /NCGR_PEP_ID=MMETSP0321-20121206/27767_1 /TAXON_ID=163516 /ORGANISM="Leptocylindrus danicus var. danicus, Strain B650" /LENGTH=163 /DNA_ID=CAMNT_0003527069 /DNA_START=2490 /DNA_END=2981 /DNA_ORIENTATION=-
MPPNFDQTTPISAADIKEHDSTSEIEKELADVRAQNKLLLKAIMALEQDASTIAKDNFERVWFAENRIRFPTSEHSKRLESDENHAEAIAKLRGNDGDYHHGFHSGLLAASRLFRESMKGVRELNSSEDKMNDSTKALEKKLGEKRASFPNSTVHPHGWSEVM